MKIKAKYKNIVFSFLMSLKMSCLMSAILTVYHLGLDEYFLMNWLPTWGLAFSLAFPITFMVAPVTRRMMLSFVEA